jgi:hypothetical protein
MPVVLFWCTVVEIVKKSGEDVHYASKSTLALHLVRNGKIFISGPIVSSLMQFLE